MRDLKARLIVHLQKNQLHNIYQNAFEIAEALEVNDVYNVYDELCMLELKGYLEFWKPPGVRAIEYPSKPDGKIHDFVIVYVDKVVEKIVKVEPDERFRDMLEVMAGLTDEQLDALMKFVRVF